MVAGFEILDKRHCKFQIDRDDLFAVFNRVQDLARDPDKEGVVLGSKIARRQKHWCSGRIDRAIGNRRTREFLSGPVSTAMFSFFIVSFGAARLFRSWSETFHLACPPLSLISDGCALRAAKKNPGARKFRPN